MLYVNKCGPSAVKSAGKIGTNKPNLLRCLMKRISVEKNMVDTQEQVSQLRKKIVYYARNSTQYFARRPKFKNPPVQTQNGYSQPRHKRSLGSKSCPYVTTYYW
ncbi:MAG: hypothetical protein ACJAZ0_003259 [Halioglobus sp.]|jgi:hypothetical protein